MSFPDRRCSILLQRRALQNLEVLTLQGNRFTDEGLVHLGKLSKLRSLWLCNTGDKGTSKIRGTGLKHLTALVELKELGLQDCSFADIGIPHLRPFTKLKGLHLSNCDLTVQGEAELRAMHPDCSIYTRR